MVFIPKAGRDPEDPKAYRPISLTSFLLKAMEKVIDLHLRSEHLTRKPLNQTQHAYQQKKSTISALHKLINKVENALENKKLALLAFLDIERAFDNASHSTIRKAALKKRVEAETIDWMMHMLSSRDGHIRNNR